MQAAYDRQVFINCPFDPEYRPLFEALVFTAQECGCLPRCAWEIADSGTTRIRGILDIIEQCGLGIHDISRTELNENQLPRFNMPLELGLFLGAKRFGNEAQGKKKCLILDREPYRYQEFCSDISGQDIRAHRGKPDEAIDAIRKWLAAARPEVQIPGSARLKERYAAFRSDLPIYLRALELEEEEMTFIDLRRVMTRWLQDRERGTEEAS